jgi:signal transduction histidine kinase
MTASTPPAVVIVDGSLTVRTDLSTVFEAAGFQPIPCQTLSEVQARLATEQPAAAILDVILLDGDGVSSLGELRAAGATEVVGKVRDLLGTGARADGAGTTVLLLDSAARANRAPGKTRSDLMAELARRDRELEAFSHSLSHDLRAPLRGIDGFSQALLEDCADRLDERSRDYLRRVRNGAQRMGHLIDDLVQLLNVGRTELKSEPMNVSSIARAVAADLARSTPERQVALEVQEGMSATGDPTLLWIVFENLIGNARKFAGKVALPRIQVGALARGGELHFFVRDNGAGFDMTYAEKLFRPFERLHPADDFPGTGIGLAMVHTVIERSGGRVWADSAVDRGATFYFTLPTPNERIGT